MISDSSPSHHPPPPPDDDEHRRTMAPIRHLHHLSIFLLLLSAVFWVWAFINNLRYDYVDGGVISFATVMLSSTYVLCVIDHGGNGRGFLLDQYHIDNDTSTVSATDSVEPSEDATERTGLRHEPNALEAIQGSSQCKRRALFILPISSSLLVTLNYALGSVLTEHLWGKVYCAAFTGLWFILALLQFVLTRRVFRVVDSAEMPTRRRDDEAVEQDDASGMEGSNEGAGTIT
uniref:Uncharacterized protein n=1 Tax=Minutocellus polymorphus TaxID=265543 RepID=A0A7S0B2A8_9STRA|mmetsp:Transcript_9579/g.15921  ORF Transcript_9579/g.15921 Transcript_9579/m.15921 type:complete len:232 (+) Transcript_9579:107-802(+)